MYKIKAKEQLIEAGNTSDKLLELREVDAQKAFINKLK